MSQRDKLILAGLYLSKFDKLALDELGFISFQEAFNILGFSLGGKPSSIKNYRDEFDPLFENNRKGWHKREMRGYLKEIYDGFYQLDFFEFSELVKSTIITDYSLLSIGKTKKDIDYEKSIAKRILTGKAAEVYFMAEYKKIDIFSAYQIKDTTNLACGFDFRLTYEEAFYCIEVKGLNENKGSIQLTEKEFFVAQNLKSSFCLFIVKNFKEKPIHETIFDPLNSQLKFKEIKREIIQINYSTSI